MLPIVSWTNAVLHQYLRRKHLHPSTDTMAKQKRDSDYFLQRMMGDKDKRAVYADYKAGAYKSVRSAAIAAGLIKEPTKLDALKRAWKKATPAERDDFLKWANPSAPSSGAVVDTAGYPEDWVGVRVWEIIRRRGIERATVSKELGLKPLDASLWGALTPKVGRRSKIRPTVVTALEKWLADNEDV